MATQDGAFGRLISAHDPIGASTGFMRELRGDWPAQVELAASISTAAVELSALSEQEVEPLLGFLESGPELPFEFVSVHGPAKGRLLDEEALVELLLRVAEHCDGVVMHPDSMGEPAPYRRLGDRLLIENLDRRTRWGRRADELEEVFAALPEARFCFDIAHAWSIEGDARLGGALLDSFGARLSHVHLSSLDADLHHVPLTGDDAASFAPVLERCLGRPWILEAPPRRD